MNASSINQQALLKAGGIGAAVVIVTSLLTTGISVIGTSAGGDAGQALAGIAGVLGWCGCCVAILAYIGVGALYGHFAGQTGTPVEMGPLALGGAVTGVAVGFISGLCSGALAVATGANQMSQFGGLSGSDAVAAGAGAVVGALIFLCIGVVISAALGAAGGAIYAAVQGNKATPAAPPPAM